MKTKLLLLIMIICSFAKAQIQAPGVGTLVSLNITQNSARVQFNVNYNGSFTNYSVIYSKSANLNPAVGQTPNGNVNVFGWQTRFFDIGGLEPNTTYYWRVTASNGLGTTQSQIVNFTTLGVPAVPVINNVSSSGINYNSAKINYLLKPNHASTTSVVKYGLASNALNNQVTGLTASGNVDNSGQVSLTALLSLTTYYYQVEATNSAGTGTSNIESFTTLEAPTPQIIAEYNFNNTYNNVNGIAPFTNNAGLSFVADRNGNANSAINIANTGTRATIPNLPYGNNPRTISLWVKLNVMRADYNMLFSYGQQSNSSSNGGSINAGGVMYLGYNNNFQAPSTANATNTWYHIVYTYDGTNAKIYKNGTFLGTTTKSWNTLNNSDAFDLGVGVGGELWFDGSIDDLKIYNYALSDSDVSNLYSTETLGIAEIDKNTKVNVYPNPVKDILNIKAIENIKSVEIFNFSGGKVKETNSSKIDMSQLSTGSYIVRITDEKGNISIQKIIKK